MAVFIASQASNKKHDLAKIQEKRLSPKYYTSQCKNAKYKEKFVPKRKLKTILRPWGVYEQRLISTLCFAFNTETYFLQSSSTSSRIYLGFLCFPMKTLFDGMITSYKSIPRYLKKEHFLFKENIMQYKYNKSDSGSIMFLINYYSTLLLSETPVMWYTFSRSLEFS